MASACSLPACFLSLEALYHVILSLIVSVVMLTAEVCCNCMMSCWKNGIWCPSLSHYIALESTCLCGFHVNKLAIAGCDQPFLRRTQMTHLVKICECFCLFSADFMCHLRSWGSGRRLLTLIATFKPFASEALNPILQGIRPWIARHR